MAMITNQERIDTLRKTNLAKLSLNELAGHCAAFGIGGRGTREEMITFLHQRIAPKPVNGRAQEEAVKSSVVMSAADCEIIFREMVQKTSVDTIMAALVVAIRDIATSGKATRATAARYQIRASEIEMMVRRWGS